MATKAPSKPVTTKKVFTPRPQRPAEERLPKLYRGLTDQLDEGHFANAIKTCRKILNLDAKSETAFQTLLFLHLQTDDYASALALLDKPPSSASLEFERAYCLYRLHREQEALQELGKISTKGRKEEHLEAQIHYRLGDYAKAQDLYDDLLAGCDSSSAEHPDIIDNLSATTAHLDFDTHGYHSHLSAPQSVDISSSSQTHMPSEADLESFVPSLPTGWATGGVDSAVKKSVATSSAPTKSGKTEKESEQKKRRRHKLPKGAVEGRAFTEDPDRWMPLKQRASYITAMSKKKGQSLSMGTGMTQGSTAQAAASGGGGGAAKKKKGKK